MSGFAKRFTSDDSCIGSAVCAFYFSDPVQRSVHVFYLRLNEGNNRKIRSLVFILILFFMLATNQGKQQNRTYNPFIHWVKLHFPIKRNPARVVAGLTSN